MSKTDKKDAAKAAPEKTEGVARRDFLRNAGLGAAAVAGAAAGVKAMPAKAAENAEERKKQRYRETEHVKRYYDSNRL